MRCGRSSGPASIRSRPAIVTAQGTRARDRRAADFQSVTGKGVTGVVEGHQVLMGNASCFGPRGCHRTAGQRGRAAQERGQTVVFIAIDGQPAGIVGVADPVKPTTPKRSRQLHATGLGRDGHGRPPCDRRGRRSELGSTAVEAEVLPDEKAPSSSVCRRKGGGGHGGRRINDAPALAQADVGHRHGHRYRRGHRERRHHPRSRATCAASCGARG